VRPILIFGDTESGRSQRMVLMSFYSLRNIACVVKSIGTFVADISVVAALKDLSQDVTNLIDSQSVLLSSNTWRSLFLETKELIVSW
jgi:hypothetical protein